MVKLANTSDLKSDGSDLAGSSPAEGTKIEDEDDFIFQLPVLDHGFVALRNVAGPTRRYHNIFDAEDRDPAQAARISFNDMDKERTEEQDLKLAEYLLKNKHTSPFEMIEVWLEMKLPIFVARQFVRHRTVSINEVSGRYVQLPKEWYIPRPEHVGIRPKNVKQGRVIEGEATREAVEFCMELDQLCMMSYNGYEAALQEGIPPEVARMMLHLNHYTHWLWKQDLHNIMHFLSLRVHGHAQFEAQEYSRVIIKLLEQVLPETMKLFYKYKMEA